MKQAMKPAGRKNPEPEWTGPRGELLTYALVSNAIIRVRARVPTRNTSGMTNIKPLLLLRIILQRSIALVLGQSIGSDRICCDASS